MTELTPITVDDIKDHDTVTAIEQRLGIDESRPVIMSTCAYTLRRGAGELVYAMYPPVGGPVGYLVVGRAPSGTLLVDAQDSQGRGLPGNTLTRVPQALRRIHDAAVLAGLDLSPTVDELDPAMDEKLILAHALYQLNSLPAAIGAQWYKTETTLSKTAREDGKLRRIELWYLTDAAAEDNELKKP